MRHVYLSDELKRQEFADRAAKHFASNPQHWTYADGNPEAGNLLALRWGLGDDCVLVLTVSDEEPVIYGQMIRDAKAAQA